MRFGAAAQRRFSPTSFAFSARGAGGEGWQASASIGVTERAPAYYELFANGVHVATAAYERGDPGLPTERSRHAEIGLAWTQGVHSVKASVFNTRFSRFLSLDATGVPVIILGENGEPDSEVPEYSFRAVRAHMSGIELEGRTRLITGAAASGFALDLSGGLDTVRGTNADSGEPLPRLAPLRVRLALQAQTLGWHAGVGLRHSANQTRVPSTDIATSGHTLLDLWAGGALPVPGVQWFAKLSNVSDELAYNAATVATMRGLSPLAGRALSLGVRGRF
jgi:iron complex outermembrane receptor protein